MSRVDAQGRSKRGAAVFGKCALHRGLIFGSAEPDQRSRRAVGIKKRAIHGASLDVPMIWMSDAGLGPSARAILNQEDVTDILQLIGAICGEQAGTCSDNCR